MAFLKVKNRAASTLASGVDDAVTEWTVATGEGALFPTAGDFHVTCEDEIVKCTSRSTDVLTVTRAQEGTGAAAHASGKAVELRITAEIITQLQMQSKGKAYRNGDWYMPTSTWTRVPLNAESYDNQNEWDTTSKIGTADATEANKLHDADGGFASGDVGKWVYNTTDHTYTTVTAFVDSGELTLADDIMADTEGYELYAGIFTATEAGYYQVNGVVRCNWTLADKAYFCGVAKNGTLISTGGWQAAVGDGVASNYISGVVPDVVYLAASDYIELQINHTEGDPGKFRGEVSQTFMSVHKLS